MTKMNSFGADTFEGIDMSELDLLDIEIVETAGVMGIPETGASCCVWFACGSSSCRENPWIV
ncbi:MAG TPA: thiopeptide-type bacteriocin [Allosphingosinicella sp.]|nr:thiopeptide-type bacteriocin [Allosphingosinicella sp.]